MLRCLQVYRGVQWTNNAGCRTFDVRPLEVEGFPLVQRRFVHSFWTISGTDVAEAAFWSAGHARCRLVGSEPTDQGSEVLFELAHALLVLRFSRFLYSAYLRCC